MASTTVAAIHSGQTAPAAKTRNIIDYLDDPRVGKGISAVAGQFLTPDRFLRLAINAVKKTPLLLQCDTQSVLGAFMASAALGLEPNTILQQAFLIPYKKSVPKRDENGDIVKDARNKWIYLDTYECQFQIGYRGFITLAHRSPHIAGIQAESIHDGDLFDHMLGSESFLKYRKALKDRGDLIGSFCYTRLESGMEIATVLPLDEVYKIRSKSETYNALMRLVQDADNAKEKAKAEKKLAETPWVMWEDDMAAKSAIKKHAKQLPLNPGDAINAAAAIDNGADANVIDMRAMADPDVARGVVRDGYEPPALEHTESDRLPMDLGQQADLQEVRQASAAEQRQQSAQGQHGEWTPTAEELAAIRAREMREASQQEQPARRGRGQQSLIAE